MENVTTLSRYELERVRFAKGALAPRGQIYYPKQKTVVTDEQMRAAIKHGIKKSVNLTMELIRYTVLTGI